MGNPLYPGNGSQSAAASSSSSSTSTPSSSGPGLLGGSFAASSSKTPKAANEYDPSFHPGILNLGNTCFLNSVVQAIGNTRDFRLLLQGPSVSASYSDEPLTPTTFLASSRQYHWPNRSQSPALRVCDNEYGRRITHQPNPNGNLDSSLASLDALPAHDPAGTIKSDKQSLPAQVSQPPQNGAARASGSSGASADVYEPDVLDLPLNTAFRHVLEKFWTDGHQSRSSVNINPKRLLSQIGKKYDQYLEYGQQDGHELMRHLLDACRMEELDVIKKMRPPPPAQKKARIDHANSLASAATASPINQLTPADLERGQVASHPAASTAVEADGVSAAKSEEQLVPFLDLLFCGKLASMVVCEGCRKVSHTYEDFYDISLSLRDDATNPKSRKRDRLRSMADRWRRATQGRTIVDRKSAAAATTAASSSITPIGTPRFSENEESDADANALQRNKSTGFRSPDEGGRSRFKLRTRSLRRNAGRHEKLGATSGSEMEPDFPDMASLSLAPSVGSRPYVDSAPASAGEDDGDARTGSRVARMLGDSNTAADSSSREASPNPSTGDRAAAPSLAVGMRPPLQATKSTSHQSAYIARILADDPAGVANSGVLHKAVMPSPLFNAVAAATAAQGKPTHGFFRSAGTGAHTRDPCADFEPDPKSQGAKRRQKIREEQAATGLIAALRQFTSVEVLDGENSFACKNCWRLANPPNAQEREQIRRRRRRRGVAATEVDDDEGSEPSSSEGESDRETENQEARHTVPTATDKTLVSQPMTSGTSTSTSNSTLASSSVDSIVTGCSASQPSQQASEIPTISMTSTDASLDGIDSKTQGSRGGSLNGGHVVARDYAGSPGAAASTSANSSNGVVMQQKTGSQSSLSSVEGSATAAAGPNNRDRTAPNNGYETGTETDMSGFSTGVDESNASTGDGTDTEAISRGKRDPTTSERTAKRSAQSLPRRALKRYLIASAPPVLIFHLKRFQATGRGFVSGLAGFKKIDDQVTFPEFLDITPWLAPPREEYDRRGRLKASSDPLAIRRRAEEEAIKAGVDASRVQVEVSGAHGRGHRKSGHRGERKGKKHGMWSWHLSDQRHGADAAARGGDLEEGPKVRTSGGQEVVPSVVRRPKTEYRLYAVIVHQGSLSAGHYTAYVLSDRIKLKESQKELVARSAPTSRTNTPAPLTNNANATLAANSKDGGGIGQFFLGGNKPSRNTASPAPVPVRPASAAPASSVAMKSVPSTSSVSGSSLHDIAPQTSNSSVDTDASQRSTTSSAAYGSGSDSAPSGPKLIRPRPQLKPMTSWDSLDELEQLHAQATGVATPTMPLEPTPAVPTVASHKNNAHRHVGEVKPDNGVEDDDDDAVDPRKQDDGRRWVYTSDTIVRAATIDEVLKAKAYMLFYERL